MSCFNFGREDEELPFEERALKFLDGRLPLYKEFKVPTWREETLKRLKSFKNLLVGKEEEPLIDYLIKILEREKLNENTLKKWHFLIENYLFPLLEKLIFYRANSPLGKEEVELKVKEIGELPGAYKPKTPEEAINKVILLLNGGEDD